MDRLLRPGAEAEGAGRRPRERGEGSLEPPSSEASVPAVGAEADVDRALDGLRARLRVHVEGPLLDDHAAARKVALAEAGWLVDATLGRIAPLHALAIARGELYAQLVSSHHWRRAQGATSDAAIRDGVVALARVRAGGFVTPDPAPTRAGLEALLIAIARQVQEEIPAGQGADDDVDRIARLWRYALSPFLRPFHLREHPAAPADELRGPFDSLVYDHVELAFRELGHARITAPPFGGRPLGAWIAELHQRREGVLQTLTNQQRTRAWAWQPGP